MNGLGYGYWGSFTAKEQNHAAKVDMSMRAAYLR